MYCVDPRCPRCWHTSARGGAHVDCACGSSGNVRYSVMAALLYFQVLNKCSNRRIRSWFLSSHKVKLALVLKRIEENVAVKAIGAAISVICESFYMRQCLICEFRLHLGRQEAFIMYLLIAALRCQLECGVTYSGGRLYLKFVSIL